SPSRSASGWPRSAAPGRSTRRSPGWCSGSRCWAGSAGWRRCCSSSPSAPEPGHRHRLATDRRAGLDGGREDVIGYACRRSLSEEYQVPNPAGPPAGTTVALVGAGGIAGVHLQAWLALGADVRVYSHASAARLVAEVGGGAVADSLEEALDGATIADVVTP